MYELYGSGSAQLGRLFGAGRFDRGLVMLLACVKELLNRKIGETYVGQTQKKLIELNCIATNFKILT